MPHCKYFVLNNVGAGVTEFGSETVCDLCNKIFSLTQFRLILVDLMKHAGFITMIYNIKPNIYS